MKTAIVNWIKNRMNQLQAHIQNAGLARTKTMLKRWVQGDLIKAVKAWRDGCELWKEGLGRLRIRMYHWLESQANLIPTSQSNQTLALSPCLLRH